MTGHTTQTKTPCYYSGVFDNGEITMQPLTPIEVAERIAAERKRTKPKRDRINVQRRRDAEFERELRAIGFDVRGGVES